MSVASLGRFVVLGALSLLSIAFVLALALCRVIGRKLDGERKTALVIVLGDIGHSPRTLNQALALTTVVDKVDIVANVIASSLPSVLRNHNQIELLNLDGPGSRLRIARDNGKFMYLITGLTVMLYRSIDLTRAILRRQVDYSVILIQNPPCLPTFLIVFLAKVLFGMKSKVVVDWHNLAFTIMQTTGTPPFIVKTAALLECCLARIIGHAHLCVSKSMAVWLRAKWGVEATVLYDIPVHAQQDLTPEEQHHLFSRIQQKPNLLADTWKTQQVHGVPGFRENRPFIIISSTSWTPDENFEILLQAFKLLDDQLLSEEDDKIILLITGKGPLRSKFEADFASAKFSSTVLLCLWVPAEDYPKLLASCDLGVCMHSSSSGLDLPMKVVDMLGSNLPVCALQYETIAELVSDGQVGFLFQNPEELAKIILRLMKAPAELQRMRSNIRNSLETKEWMSEWRSVARPIFWRLVE